MKRKKSEDRSQKSGETEKSQPSAGNQTGGGKLMETLFVASERRLPCHTSRRSCFLLTPVSCLSLVTCHCSYVRPDEFHNLLS